MRCLPQTSHSRPSATLSFRAGRRDPPTRRQSSEESRACNVKIPSGSTRSPPHRTTIQRGISHLQRQDSSLDNCPVRCDFFDPLGMTRRRLVGKSLPHQSDRCAVSPNVTLSSKRHTVIPSGSKRSSHPTTVQRGISRLQRPDSSHSTGSGHALRSPCHCAPATHSPAAHTPTATTVSALRPRSAFLAT